MPDPSRTEEIALALLAYMRNAANDTSLNFADAPQPLLGGNRTFVYGFSLADAPKDYASPMVLRVLRSGGDPAGARLEAAVQTALVELGYPAPRVLAWSDSPDVFGGAFQVMERIPGGPIVLGDPPEEMTGRSIFVQILPELGRLLFGHWPQLFAEVQVRLHELDAGAFLRHLEKEGVDRSSLSLEAAVDRVATEAEGHGLVGLQPTIEWLRQHRPPSTGRLSVCHGDFFPNQVFARDGAITGVIDWSDVVIGPAELDVGIVKAGIETLPGPLGPVGVALQRFVARRYIAAYRRLRSLDPTLLDYSQAFRCLRVLVAVATRRLASDGPIAPGPNPYDDPLGEARLAARLYELTGERVSIPPPSR